MRTLLLGRPSARRIRVQRLLSAAGEDVEVCRESDWGCAGLEDACPLDGREIDVAVAVTEPGLPFDAQGLACLHRARIPLVTIGARRSDPVTEHAAANVERIDDDAVEVIRDASHDVTGHRRAVEAELAARLADDEHVDVALRRRPGAIDIVLTGDLAPDRAVALTDVARAALRAYDARVAVINVSATTP